MKKYILPIILIVLLTLTCFANASDLFGTYDKRIKLTIDHTKIDADLSWFPITVFLGNYGDAIDVGAAATNRGITESAGFTIIAKNNPANSSGTITSVEIYAETNMNGVIVATFSADGNNITARDSYSIGSVTAGSKQTFEVELSVETGDYLGFYNSSGGISLDDTGGDGRWYKSGDYTDCVDEAFTSGAGTIYSIYATGFEKSQGAEVFTEFDADEDFDRIAFTSSDGETQLYTDCELFDDSEQKAIYHVSKTGWTVSSSTDTDIYLYYDNTADHNTSYISKSGGTAAQSVWDSSFKAVYHMNDPEEPTYDTEYDGSVKPDSDGWTLGGTDYSSSDGDILTIDTSADDTYTCYYYKSPDVDFDAGVYVKTRVKLASGTDGFYIVIQDSSQGERFYCYFSDGGGTYVYNNDIWSSLTVDLTTTFHIIEIYIKESTFYIYVDSILKAYNTVDSQTLADDKISFGDLNPTVSCNANIDYFNYALDISYNPAIGIIDATSNANHGTKKGSSEPAEATGKVGQGQDFDGTDDYISTSLTIPALATTDDYTWELVCIDNGTYEFRNKPIIGNRYGGTSSPLQFIKLTPSGFEYYIGGQEGITFTTGVSTTALEQNTIVKDGTTLTHYRNGAASGDSSTISSNIDSNPFFIGGDSGGEYSKTTVDEVRISSTARSAAWISATYSTLWDTLLTYGSEETGGTTEEATNVLFIFSNF